MKKLITLLSIVLFFSCNSDDVTSQQAIEQDELIIGVNTQRAFRSNFHKGLTESEVIERVAELINRFKFNSIRIGGTASFGGTFDPNYMGFGWAKYLDNPEVAKIHPTDPFTNEPYNYNIIALKTAKKADVSVWIDLHRYMTKEDIEYTMHLVDSLGIRLAGVTRDNEPYIPKREATMEDAYAEFTNERFNGYSWPAMSVIPTSLGEQGGRALIQNRCVALVNQYRKADESIEIHSYVPKQYTGTPKTWITSVLEATRDAYGISNDKIMLGEWNGKNQETFTNEAIETIIADHLEVLQSEQIDSYYQVLGSGYDEVGLFNFLTNTENRGANVFKNR